MARSTRHSYPPAYARILLSLAEDGTPLALKLSSHAAATAERLQMYNWLKFLRRNPTAAQGLGNRYQRLQIQLKEETLIFQLRAGASFTELDSALNEALSASGQLPINMAEMELTAVPDIGDSAPSAPVDPDPDRRASPLDILNRSLKK